MPKNNRKHASTEAEYLSSITISIDDPGLFFNWDEAAMAIFIGFAVAPRINAPPVWLLLPGMTVHSCKTNIMGMLSLVAGGSFGETLIAPNNLVQFGNVIGRISHIECDPFIQECMMLMPANSVLATLAIITDRTIVHNTPAARVIVAPNRLVFA